MEMGSEFGSAESLWTAMRALGILEGTWGMHTRLPLKTVLHPETLRINVLPKLEPSS